MAYPTKFEEGMTDQTVKLCRLGATDADLADFFGVCTKTIENWRKKEPAFLEACRRGKLQADAEVADSLYHRATGYTRTVQQVFQTDDGPLTVDVEKYFPPDVTACIFWLKNRQKENWRDRWELSGPGGGAIPAKFVGLQIIAPGLPANGDGSNGKPKRIPSEDQS